MSETRTVVYWGTITFVRGRLALRQEGPGELMLQPDRGDGGQSAQARRILMIEDDEALATMYRLRLEHAGHTVAIASTSESGLERVRAGGYDLVFLDLGLPDGDGIDILSTLRGDQLDVAVVVLTNFADASARARSLELGARAYVIKADVTPAWLAQQVDAWI